MRVQSFVFANAGVYPYVVPADCTLTQVASSAPVVVGNDPSYTWNDYNGAGVLPDGQLEGPICYSSGAPSTSGFQLKKDQTIFLALGGGGIILLFLDESSAAMFS